jgi:hypothetical protein
MINTAVLFIYRHSIKLFNNFIKRKLAEFLYPEIDKIQGEKMYNTFSNSDYMK